MTTKQERNLRYSSNYLKANSVRKTNRNGPVTARAPDRDAGATE